MHVLLFGATGMIGRGALRECLLAADVQQITAVVRKPTGHRKQKLREVVVPDVSDLTLLRDVLPTVDACLYCLGVSSFGMSESAYTAVTYDLTLSIARTLASANPKASFLYVSGAGTDSSARGRIMWARVKGRTENDLLRLPFRGAYMFRPGAIIPLHGIRPASRLYNVMYALLRPLLPIARRIAPNSVTTTEELGRAMLAVARTGYPSRVLETADIRRAGSTGGPAIRPAGLGERRSAHG